MARLVFGTGGEAPQDIRRVTVSVLKGAPIKTRFCQAQRKWYDKPPMAEWAS
ncbi:MAG: hypothetical protein MRJ68_16395 [Nitrospira sp.]|nr:hypothetical protein [Nitrospira sp.]